MICVSMVGSNVYEVVVEQPVETVHRVTLSPEYHERLCGRTITAEWVLIQSFKFLLEREPNTAILESFDLEDINSYFPEYEEQIVQRLGARG